MIDNRLSEKNKAKQIAQADAAWLAARMVVYCRLVLSIAFIVGYLYQSVGSLLGFDNSAIFFIVANIYLLISVLAVVAHHFRWPSFSVQIYLFSVIDIIVTMIFMHTSGGLSSGLGVLLVIIVASTGALTRPRVAIAYAAGATLLVLAEHAYSVVERGADTSYFLQVGLLGATLFISAFVFGILAQQLKNSELLAERRGIDLANMAQLNEYIIQRMGAGVVVVDNKMTVRLMNEAARLLFGLSSKQGLPLLEQISKPLVDRLVAWQRDPNFEASIFRVVGSVAIYPRFTRLGTEEFAGALILLEDTSVLDQQAQHMKMSAMARLTASIAHEIRNPLGAISHAGQLLEESPNLDRADKRLTQIIREQSVRMNTIIENVMQLTRRDKSMSEKIALNHWLKKFVTEFAQMHDVSPHKIGLDIVPKQVEIMFDPSHLHQILSNLCQNGCRHGGDQTGRNLIEIRGGYSRDVQGAFLDVLDYGPGIDAEMASQIFEPFFTTAKKGTGLGLYIARELAEANQAHLDYLPIRAGGSCFRLTFASDKKRKR